MKRRCKSASGGIPWRDGYCRHVGGRLFGANVGGRQQQQPNSSQAAAGVQPCDCEHSKSRPYKLEVPPDLSEGVFRTEGVRRRCRWTEDFTVSHQPVLLPSSVALLSEPNPECCTPAHCSASCCTTCTSKTPYIHPGRAFEDPVQSRAIPCVCLCCCSPQAQVLVVWDADGHSTKVIGCRSVLILPEMPPK